MTLRGAAPMIVGAGAFLALLTVAVPALAAADRSEPRMGREVGPHHLPWRARMLVLDPTGPLPADLVHPEGRSRWDLTQLPPGTIRVASIEIGGDTADDSGRDLGFDIGQDPGADGITVTDVAADPPSPSSKSTAAQLPIAHTLYDRSAGGDGALRYLFPDCFTEERRLGVRTDFDLEETVADGRDRLRITVTTIGSGWVHLPSRPHEVVLQRVLVLRGRAASGGYEPDQLIHRWVDPLEGIVAEIRGPASADGQTRTAVSSARVLETLLTPAAVLKIHQNEIDSAIGIDVLYAWDRGSGTAISSLTPDHWTNIGQLVAASSWDFSGNTSGNELVSYAVGVESAESCNLSKCNGGSNAGATCDEKADCPGGTCTVGLCNGGSNPGANCDEAADCTGGGSCRRKGCGYNKLPAGGGFATPELDRRDKNPATSLEKSNSVSQVETQANKVVFWLRGGSQKEGVSGSFGTGETRFCYFPYDDNFDGNIQAGEVRGQVPEWVLPHNDADGKGFYLQAGDDWGLLATCAGGANAGLPCVGPSDCPGGSCGQCVGGTTPGAACSSFSNCPGTGASCNATFNCEQIAYNQICGAPALVDRLYGKGCTGSNGSPHHGKQTGGVIKNGILILPSGHTFNALLGYQLTDFCVYSGSGCALKLDEVRTSNYLWQVPRLGTLARLQSVQNATDTTSYTSVAETSFSFGLFPPRSIQVTGSTNTTVALSWNPGNDTHRISGYKIYWDTAPRTPGSPNYAFNSVTNAGQVVFAGTTATISGLTSGTTYYFTVTSLSTFTRTEVSPAPPVAATYESVRYPTQVFGDPSFAYPIEVLGTTTGGSCTPTAPVTNLLVTKAGANTTFCWSPVSDPCLIGYRVLGSAVSHPAGSFATVADVGLTTCYSGSVAPGFFLVKARGTGGVGP